MSWLCASRSCFGREVHLQVRPVGGAPQEVVADEAVEVEGGRVAGVELEVAHLGHRRQVALHLARGLERHLERRALGVVDEHLELALVVERQHLDLDEAEAHRRHREDEHQRHRSEEGPALDRARDERVHHKAVQAGDAARRRPLPAVAVRKIGALEQAIRGPRGHHEGDRQREQHGCGGAGRDRPHVGAHQAPHERHRQDRRDHGEGGEDGRVADLVHRFDRRAQQRLALLLAVVALDVLDHHDRVVHQDAYGEDQGKEGDAIEGVAGQEVDEEGEREGDGHRDADHQTAAPAHGERDERDDRQRRDQEVVDELVRLLLGCLAVVACDLDLDLGRDQARAQVLELLQDGLRERARVRPRPLGERNRDGGMLAAGRLAVSSPGRTGREEDGVRGLVGPVDDARDLRHIDGPSLGQAHHHAADLLGAAEERTDLDADLPVVANGGARRLLDRGRLQRPGELHPADPRGRHAVGVRLHAHHPRLAADQLGAARLGDLGELLRQLGRERPQPVARPALGPQREAQERDVVDRVQLDDRRHHVARHDPAHGRLPLVDLDQAVLVRLADLEADGHHPHARARHRVDVLDTRDAPQDPLDRSHDPVLDLGGLGARPGHHHVDHRHADLRLLLAGSGEERERPEAERGPDDERRELAVEEGVGDLARESDAHAAISAPPERIRLRSRPAAR